MLMVLMLHVNVFKDWSGTGNTEAYYALAGIAIPLFFMTSGYLMANKQTDWKYAARKIWGILRFTLIICLTIYAIDYVTYGKAHFQFPECYIQRGGLAVFWYFGAMIIIYAAPAATHNQQSKVASAVDYFPGCFWKHNLRRQPLGV